MGLHNIGRYTVTTPEALAALYEPPGWAAHAGETDCIIAPYRAYIEAAPYVTVATVGPDGPDCSPRGDDPGFVRVSDEKTLLIPDRAGNNRIETLRNIVHDPRIALHFVIPGCGETLRVKGRAAISIDPTLTGSMTENSKAPRSVIVVTVESVYYHCAKAIRRAKLWDPSRHVGRGQLPGPNAMVAAVQWRRCRTSLRRPRAKS